jgi:hypothetical protein
MFYGAKKLRRNHASSAGYFQMTPHVQYYQNGVSQEDLPNAFSRQASQMAIFFPSGSLARSVAAVTLYVNLGVVYWLSEIISEF